MAENFADMAAIAWCIAKTLEQAQNIKLLTSTYKKALKQGADAGGKIKIPFNTTDPNLEFDLKTDMDLSNDGIWQTFTNADNTEYRYAKVYITDEVENGRNPINGVSWTYKGKICADIYDADGNYIETQNMITSGGNTVWCSTKTYSNYGYCTRSEDVTKIVTFGEGGKLSCGIYVASYDSSGNVTFEQTIEPNLNLYQLILGVDGYTYVSTSNTKPI